MITLDKKIEILGDYYTLAIDDPTAMEGDFMKANHYTVFLCLAILVKWVKPDNTERLGPQVDSTWSDFCDYFGVDKYGDFDSLSEFVGFANEQG
jgi:hypothetical protein